MDPDSLAASISTALGPYLPYLVKAGESVASSAGEKFGGELWERARAFWYRLRPTLEAKPAALQAASDAADAPDDADALAAFRFQLKKLLEENPSLAGELQPEMEQLRAYIHVEATGVRSVAIGGNFSGGVINTGDRIIHHQ